MEEQVVTKHTRSGLELQNRMLFDRLDALLNATSNDPDRQSVIDALMEAISENTRQIEAMPTQTDETKLSADDFILLENTVTDVEEDSETERLINSFEDISAHPAQPIPTPAVVQAVAPAPAESNSPPKKAFFEGLIRRNSDEERAAKKEAKAAQEYAKFQASLRSATSSAEFDPELPGKQPKLSLMKVSKK
ncbi:MAG TPA: hypothetical protein VGV92_08825 [Gammaproteobacteria bacterium]|nr:hypothetical protein [Gammaproteobacteria bacterium]